MTRASHGFMTTAGGIGALALGLAIIDERVREHVVGLASGRGPSGELVSAGERLAELARVTLLAVREQSIEHAPLTLFAVVALVLFTLMLRS